MKSLIPLRPEGFVSSLSQEEQTALSWFVISGCSRKDAFLTFCRPDMLGSKAKAAIDDYVKQFFAQKAVKDYIEAYEATLDKFLHPAPVKSEQTASLEERKAKARSKLVEFAMTLADNIDQSDDPEYVLKIADKCNLLDGYDEIDEVPRRYLPTSCDSCSYRFFVEENTEWMCPMCKYYQFGEKNGVHYEKENILVDKVAE